MTYMIDERSLNCCGSREGHLSSCETLHPAPMTEAGGRLLTMVLKSRRARLTGATTWKDAIAAVEEEAVIRGKVTL